MTLLWLWAFQWVVAARRAQEQKITKHKDGSIVVWMKTSGWYDVQKWVLSFGADAEVLEPVKMREEIQKEIWTALERYNKRDCLETSPTIELH